MGTTYAEYILSLYEIRKKKDIPFIREVVNYKGKLDEKYRGRLQLLLLCFYDIECLNGKIRVALKKLSPFILSLEKKIDSIQRHRWETRRIRKDIREESSSTREEGHDWVVSLLREAGVDQLKEDARSEGPGIIYDYGDVMSGICTLWDNTAKLFWGFYEVPIEERLAKFPYICSFRRGDEGLAPFFIQSGIDFDKNGGAHVKEDSPLLPLMQYRNRVRHNITGTDYTMAFEVGEFTEKVIRYWDHYEERMKTITIVPPKRWRRISEEGYVHFVKSYNSLIDVFEQTAEKRGRV